MSTKNILVTLTGPSVTGKSRLAALLAPYGFEELVSTTTRPPRSGEVNGIHYNFVKPEAFTDLLANRQMIESIPVGNYFYGLSRPALDKVISKGKNAVAVVEPNGAQNIGAFCRDNNIEVYQVFVDNHLMLLLERLFQRFQSDKLADPRVYAQRAVDMQGKEQKEWVAPAYDGTHHYDKIFKSFTLDNEQDVVAGVIEGVQQRLNQKKASRPKPV